MSVGACEGVVHVGVCEGVSVGACEGVSVCACVAVYV